MPLICKKLGAIEIISNTSDSTLTFKINNDRKVSVPAHLSGIFENTTTFPASQDIDLQWQTGCFYIDYDPSSKIWKYVIPANKDLMGVEFNESKRYSKASQCIHKCVLRLI